QTFDTADNAVIDAIVGVFEIVANGFEAAFGPIDGLAFDGGVGIRFFDEGAGTTDNDLFEQIEKGDTAILLAIGAAGDHEVALEVADTGGGEIAAVAAGKEVDLIVEVKDGVVDGGCGEQDQLFALAADDALAVVGCQQAFEAFVALG